MISSSAAARSTNCGSLDLASCKLTMSTTRVPANDSYDMRLRAVHVKNAINFIRCRTSFDGTRHVLEPIWARLGRGRREASMMASQKLDRRLLRGHGARVSAACAAVIRAR